MKIRLVLFASLLSFGAYATIDDEIDTDYLSEKEDEFAFEDDFYGDDDFISIATGTMMPAFKAPAVASVITAADIQRMGATHLDEVLEQVPGLHVMPSNLSRLDSMFSIRGIQGGFNPHILVMLDGVEIKKNATGGLPSTFRFGVSNIARIEIIRGPGSAVYGADAFSGVINIISKSIEETSMTIGGRVGSFNSEDFWLNANYQNDDFGIRLAVNTMQSDGDDQRIAQTDLQSIFDGFFSTSASNAPGPLATHYDILNVQADIKYKDFSFKNWWWQQDKGGLGAGGAQAIDHTGYQNYDSYRGVVNYAHPLDDDSSLNFRAYYQNALEESFFLLFPKDTTLPIGNDGNVDLSQSGNRVLFSDGLIGAPTFDQTDYGISGTIENNSWINHKLRINFGYVKKDLDTSERKNFGPGVIDVSKLDNDGITVIDGQLKDISSTEFVFMFDTSRHNAYLSVQDEWQIFNDVEIVAGARYDRYSDFGSAVNPRIAVIWETSRKLTTKFLYGSAFRAPAFDELGNKNNPALLGNSQLKPEKIETFEIAFDYRINFDNKIVTSFFRYQAEDLIVLLEDTGQGSAKEKNNAQEQNGYGYEIEHQWKITPALRFKANYSMQISDAVKDDVAEFTVPDAPKNTFFMALDYDFDEEISVHLQSSHIAGRQRLKSDSRSEISDYWLTNININYRPMELPISVILSIKNVFDKVIHEPSDGNIVNDFVMPSRQLWAQLEYNF